jgi:hypothetical protein
MERGQLGAAAALVASALLLGCRDGGSPVQPTAVSIPPTLQNYTIFGRVTDTAWRAIVEARVEITEGSRRGTVATTDDTGRFVMPGTFTGSTTLTTAKDGFVSSASSIPPVLGGPQAQQGGGGWEVAISLEPATPSLNIAGQYTLTLTADGTCTNLPRAAQVRTYTATIIPGEQPSSFIVSLSDARFFSTMPCPSRRLSGSCTYDQLRIGMAGNFAAIGREDIIEQLSGTTYLVIGGTARALFTGTGVATSFDGYFLYCEAEPVWDTADVVDSWTCRPAAHCNSANHQLVLVRR